MQDLNWSPLATNLMVPNRQSALSSSDLLGAPRCGLSIWPSLLAISNTRFWVYANFVHEKTYKTRKYSKSAIFVSGYRKCPLMISRCAKHYTERFDLISHHWNIYNFPVSWRPQFYWLKLLTSIVRLSLSFLCRFQLSDISFLLTLKNTQLVWVSLVHLRLFNIFWSSKVTARDLAQA